MKYFLFLLLCVAPFTAGAHKASDSFLKLRLTDHRVSGQWDIALRDLEYAIGLDENADRLITWGEVHAKEPEILRYVLPQLSLKSDNAALPLSITKFEIERHSDGSYISLQFAAPVEAEELTITYNLFFDLDAQHRGLLSINGASDLRVFSPDQTTQQVSAAPKPPLFTAFVREGVWHIWKGFDHLLFLLTLLLPAVIRRENGAWQIASAFRPVVFEITKIVTAFTIAHSITLMLAALKIVKLPPALVESAIAASVVFASVNNLVPMVRSKAWVIAFAFGLIHGFGFANVFGDLGLSGVHIVGPLVAFNIGVELGQLAIVAVYLPMAYLARESKMYRLIGVQGASVAVALIAATWTFERCLDFKILPF